MQGDIPFHYPYLFTGFGSPQSSKIKLRQVAFCKSELYEIINHPVITMTPRAEAIVALAANPWLAQSKLHSRTLKAQLVSAYNSSSHPPGHNIPLLKHDVRSLQRSYNALQYSSSSTAASINLLFIAAALQLGTGPPRHCPSSWK